jgi:hypothetical protein
MVPDPIEAIQRHTEAVERRENRPTCNRCPQCHEEPETFQLHDRRKRIFLVVVARTVRRVLSLVSRWKCPCCKVSFTFYPPFALPHKRYVKDAVFGLARAYLERDELSYRSAVEVEHMPVFYEEPGSEAPIDERSLSHSTLHRWLPFLSLLVATLAEALRLVRGRSASGDLFRRILAVASRKYRSDERRKVLERALRLLASDAEFHALFGRSIFPDLATACGWR